MNIRRFSPLDFEEEIKEVKRRPDSELEQIAPGIFARIDRNINYLTLNSSNNIVRVNGNIDTTKYIVGAYIYDILT